LGLRPDLVGTEPLCLPIFQAAGFTPAVHDFRPNAHHARQLLNATELVSVDCYLWLTR